MVFDVIVGLAAFAFQSTKSRQEMNRRNAYESTKRNHQKAVDAFAKDHCFSNEMGDRWEKELKIKQYVTDGKHYDEICQEFAPQFEYVFGENWKEELRIPPKGLIRNVAMTLQEKLSCDISANHVFWVYRLIMAKQGLMPYDDVLIGIPVVRFTPEAPDNGFKVCEKFTHCIMDMMKQQPGLEDFYLSYKPFPYDASRFYVPSVRKALFPNE